MKCSSLSPSTMAEERPKATPMEAPVAKISTKDVRITHNVMAASYFSSAAGVLRTRMRLPRTYNSMTPQPNGMTTYTQDMGIIMAGEV